jgi:hypothetical protein
MFAFRYSLLEQVYRTANSEYRTASQQGG